MTTLANPIRDTYCTTEQAARILGVHPSQLSRYTKKGLKAERIGRQLLFLKRDVQRFKRPGQGFRSDLPTSQNS